MQAFLDQKSIEEVLSQFGEVPVATLGNKFVDDDSKFFAFNAKTAKGANSKLPLSNDRLNAKDKSNIAPDASVKKEKQNLPNTGSSDKKEPLKNGSQDQAKDNSELTLAQKSQLAERRIIEAELAAKKEAEEAEAARKRAREAELAAKKEAEEAEAARKRAREAELAAKKQAEEAEAAQKRAREAELRAKKAEQTASGSDPKKPSDNAPKSSLDAKASSPSVAKDLATPASKPDVLASQDSLDPKVTLTPNTSSKPADQNQISPTVANNTPANLGGLSGQNPKDPLKQDLPKTEVKDELKDTKASTNLTSDQKTPNEPKASGENLDENPDENDAQALLAYGRKYAQGDGVKKDLKEAFKWYEKAAKLGDLDAKKTLADCLDRGIGIARDSIKARELFISCGEHGDVESMKRVGMIYDRVRPTNRERAFEWYMKAANTGDTEAEFIIGNRYRKGTGCKKDYAKAAEWFTRAAEKDHAEAQYKLAFLYEKGYGVAKDWAKADQLYARAAEQKFPDAQKRLNRLRQMAH